MRQHNYQKVGNPYLEADPIGNRLDALPDVLAYRGWSQTTRLGGVSVTSALEIPLRPLSSPPEGV
jgi:hypothetical protein